MKNRGHAQNEVDCFFEALLADEAMIETKDYLKRGRKFESRETFQLQTQWTAAFKIWFASRESDDLQVMDDTGAELRLRNLPIPFDTIRSVLDLRPFETKRPRSRRDQHQSENCGIPRRDGSQLELSRHCAPKLR
jgi:hypothetical protein